MGVSLFHDWVKLCPWLVENFTLAEPGIDTEDKMERLFMCTRQSVQEFTNTFETILQDIPWVGSDTAVRAVYH